MPHVLTSDFCSGLSSGNPWKEGWRIKFSDIPISLILAVLGSSFTFQTHALARFTASRRLLFLVALLYTLAQQVHDIDDLALLFGPWRGFRRFNGLGLTGLDLFVDQLQQILVIFVAILFGIPLACHGLD